MEKHQSSTENQYFWFSREGSPVGVWYEVYTTSESSAGEDMAFHKQPPFSGLHLKSKPISHL